MINIQDVPIGNTLIDLISPINMMTTVIYDHLRLTNFTSTPTVFELADNRRVMLVGIEDIMVTSDSWEYHVDFFVAKPK